MNKWNWFVPFGATVILMGCSTDTSTVEKPNTTSNQTGREEVIFQKLQAPWNIEKSDQTFYITERAGTIVTGVKDDYVRTRPRLSEAIVTEGEGGLLGMALDPDFKKNRRAYVYHMYEEAGELKNRVVSIEEKDGEWIEKAVLLDGIPGASIHNGGRIEIGPDDNLYVTVGDAAVPENAQKLSSLSGKILRMDLTGEPVKGNLEGYVYSYGHRNPQGLVFVDDQLFATEHGQSGHDEINQIDKKNYGWPMIEGTEKKAGFVTPWYEVGNQSVAPSGMTELGGKLYFGTLVGQSLRSIETTTKQVEQVVSDRGRVRDVMTDGGMLYYITNNTDGRGNPKKSDDVFVQLEP